MGCGTACWAASARLAACSGNQFSPLTNCSNSLRILHNGLPATCFLPRSPIIMAPSTATMTMTSMTGAIMLGPMSLPPSSSHAGLPATKQGQHT